jgi:hypothetical protein
MPSAEPARRPAGGAPCYGLVRKRLKGRASAAITSPAPFSSHLPPTLVPQVGSRLASAKIIGWPRRLSVILGGADMWAAHPVEASGHELKFISSPSCRGPKPPFADGRFALDALDYPSRSWAFKQSKLKRHTIPGGAMAHPGTVAGCTGPMACRSSDG